MGLLGCAIGQSKLSEGQMAALKALVLAGPDPAVGKTERWRIVDLCQWVKEVLPPRTQSDGYISEMIASRTAFSRPLVRSSTPVVTLGISCSDKPDASDPSIPIPGSNGSAINQVGIIRSILGVQTFKPTLQKGTAEFLGLHETSVARSLPAI
jgi:hypothetical protein